MADKLSIEDLLALAREKDRKSRELLAENTLDLFLSREGRLSDQERSLMADILSKLVLELDIAVRRKVAEHLADIEDLPPDLVKTLANDEIEVARPILERSGVLKDPELIEIIQHRGIEHQLAIALRQPLSADVTDALIDVGDEDLVEILLNNPDAELSERAMEYVVAESRHVDRFQEPLLSRSDLPPYLAYRMFWWVSSALREHILQVYTLDAHVIDGAIQSATRGLLEQQASAEGVYDKALKLVTRLAEIGDLNDAFLINALRNSRIPVFIAGLAYLARIDLNTAKRIFLDPGGEALAMACRAIGFNRSQSTTVFLLSDTVRTGRRVRDIDTLQTMTRFYDMVDENVAIATLQVWQRDSGYQSAIEEISGHR